VGLIIGDDSEPLPRQDTHQIRRVLALLAAVISVDDDHQFPKILREHCDAWDLMSVLFR